MPTPLDRALNVPHELVHEGKTYRIRELTEKQVGEFSAWCRQMAMAEVDLNTVEMPDRLRQEAITAVTRDINSGYYELGGAGFANKMNSPNGQAKLLQLGMAKDHPEINYEDCQKLILNGMLGMVMRAGWEPLGSDGDEGKAQRQDGTEPLLPL